MVEFKPKHVMLVGLLTVLVAAGVTWYCIGADASWTFGENTLSDLGVSDNPDVAFTFNIGCIVLGILFALYGFGKMSVARGYGRFAGCSIVLCACFMVLIGVFTKETGNGYIHLFAAYMLFILLGAAILMSGYDHWIHDRMVSASVVIFVTPLVLTALIFEPLPALEVIFAGAGLFWLLSDSLSTAVSIGKS